MSFSKLFAANKVANFAEFTDLRKSRRARTVEDENRSIAKWSQADLAQLEKIAQDPDTLTENVPTEEITHKQDQINLHAENTKLRIKWMF